MLASETLVVFVITSVLLSLTPGPDNIFVLTQSLVSGRKAGFLITLGLCTGLLFHTAAVVFGVAALIQSNAIAFHVLKIAGACYLLYLAWQSYHAADITLEDGNAITLSSGMLYRRGVVMNITNPKVAIFFLSFFPQFIDMSSGSAALQIIVLGSVFVLVALLVFSAIAVLSGYLKSYFMRHANSQRILKKIASFVFFAIGVKLFFG